LQTRREFLIGTAALALSACAASPLRMMGSSNEKRKFRYIVATQSRYWDQQDLHDFPVTKSLDLPGIQKFDRSLPHTVITLVNDDGTSAKRLWLPLHYHCATSAPQTNGLIYLIGNHRPSALIALDSNSLEIVSICAKPDNSDIRNFAGHGVPIPNTNTIAFSMNNFELGKFDDISIRDATSLKEVTRFSSFGFQAHEIRLSQDQKFFVCGHYGSYLGQGAYRGLGIYDHQGYTPKPSPRVIYPAAVTFVGLASGKRMKIFSDKNPGQEGHATTDDKNTPYLPNKPSRIENLPDIENHARFKEGRESSVDRGEFTQTAHSIGICLSYDPKFDELIVPERSSLAIHVTDAKNQKAVEVNLMDQILASKNSWIRPQKDFISGLEFHPDGKHYILSTSSEPPPI